MDEQSSAPAATGLGSACGDDGSFGRDQLSVDARQNSRVQKLASSDLLVAAVPGASMHWPFNA
jgi:hypothetical protein